MVCKGYCYAEGHIVYSAESVEHERSIDISTGNQQLAAAAARYEQDGNIATLIVGSGPDDAIAHYHRLAYEQFGLSNTWSMGPRSRAEIAQLNALADVGVYPPRDEPFGLVLIEWYGL